MFQPEDKKCEFELKNIKKGYIFELFCILLLLLEQF